MIDAKKLAEKTRSGELTQEEFDLIFVTVRDGPYDDDLYLLIRILGWVGTSDVQGIVEKFLYYPNHPFVSRVALQVLCIDWGLTSEYLDDLKRFIRGETWDINDDIRLMAMNISGHYLANCFDSELLKLLLTVFEDLGTEPSLNENCDYARDLIKSCAYSAIAEAMGTDYDGIFQGEETEELIRRKEFNKLDQVMLQKAHKLVEDKI